MDSPLIRSVAADANVLLAAIAHRAAVRVFRERPEILVVTTEVTLREVHEYAPLFARKYELDVDVLHEIANILPVRRYTERSYRSHIAEARRYLAQRDPDDVALGDSYATFSNRRSFSISSAVLLRSSRTEAVFIFVSTGVYTLIMPHDSNGSGIALRGTGRRPSDSFAVLKF